MVGFGVSLWLCSWIYTEQALTGFEVLLDTPSPAARHLPAWGQVYITLGQIDAAVTHFEAELLQADQLGSMFGHPFKVQLARLYIARGDLKVAKETLLACVQSRFRPRLAYANDERGVSG